MPETLKTVMLDNFSINGAMPITHEQVVQLMNNMQTSLLSAFANQQRICGSNGVDDNSILANQLVGEARDCLIFSWGERFHPVPEGFAFPNCNVKKLWDLWWLGVPNDRISAYYKIKGTWDLCSKKYIVALSKARAVMKFMVSLLTEDEHASLKRTITHQERERIFLKAWDGLCTTIYPNHEGEELDRFRIGERSYLTICENLRPFMNYA